MRRLLTTVVLSLWAVTASAAPALLTHTHAEQAGGSATSAAISTVGATLLVCALGDFDNVPGDCTDSKTNTWTCLTASSVAGQTHTRICYVVNPVTDAAHTFTIATAGSFASIAVAAFSGTSLTSPFDQQAGTTSSSSATIIPGSVTPTTSGQLIVSCVAWDSSALTTVSINSGFTITDQVAFSGGQHLAVGLAYLVHTSGAISPTWTFATVSPANGAARNATFKATAVATTKELLLMGVGQ